MARKSLSITTKREIWDKCNGRCWYCGKKLHPFFFHFDHVEAYSTGGEDTTDNLVLSCITCNISKHNMSINEWRMRLSRKYGKAKEDELLRQGLEVSKEPYGYDPVILFYFERRMSKDRLLGIPHDDNWVKFKGWSQ